MGKWLNNNHDENIKNRCQNVLTGIQPSYTVSATKTGETDEVEEVMVKHFLNTLAEIALAVASRKEVRK